MMSPKEALEIIKQNPGCIAWIDNDCWHVEKKKPEGYEEWDDGKKDDWHCDEGQLIDSREVEGCDRPGGLVYVLADEFDMECARV